MTELLLLGGFLCVEVIGVRGVELSRLLLGRRY